MTKIFGFNTEDNEIKKLHFPQEDSLKINRKMKILAVADGVTRDPARILPKTKEEFIKIYPRNSPAKIAADIFTKKFNVLKRLDEQGIRQAFEIANQEIENWNKENIPEPDYLTKDLAGCVAAGAVVVRDIAYWGFICDCGAALFDSKGELKFRTENEGPDYTKEYWERIRQKFGKTASWEMPEVRREIRMIYRNNPKNPSFGVLTGEKIAMQYVKTGNWKLKNEDMLLVYSDGMEPIIYSKKFSDKLRKRDFAGLRALCNKEIRTEGTLALYAHAI